MKNIASGGFWATFFTFCVILAAFVSFLHPIFNPDLFWHLTSAREAQALGQLLLSEEIFSFTRKGAYWVNYEWLFQTIVLKVFDWGDFRALVYLQGFLLAGALILLDRYVFVTILRGRSGIWGMLARVANVALAGIFLSARGSLQPELFSFIFLILFFFLRDSWSRRPRALDVWHIVLTLALFGSWANIHGGFVFAIGLTGLEIIALGIERSRAPDQAFMRRARIAVALCFMAFIGTLANPYGIGLYRVILAHAKDASIISGVIEEWKPSQLYDPGTWIFWGVFILTLALLVYQARRNRRLNVFDILVVTAFGMFASGHVRNVGLFGVVCLPVFWRHLMSPLGSDFKKVVVILTIAGLLVASGYLGVLAATSGGRIYHMKGIPKDYVAGGNFPAFALNFIEREPRLLKLKALVDWGWAGFAEWRLYRKGLRVYFDGRYLFHDLLHELQHAAAEPKEWGRIVKASGVEMLLIHYTDEYKPVNVVEGGAQIMRNWHGVAIDPEQWALIWWDENALLFVDREKVDAPWLAAREYKIPIPYDPYLVEYYVKEGVLKPEAILKEVSRNAQEAGWNRRNKALFAIALRWAQHFLIQE
ncbi:MAG: hypothetical protein AABZ44_10545 [Elusimicrobiota bacterium]